MAKMKSPGYYCKSCGFESAKWMGQCPGCKEWNSFVEAPVNRMPTTGRRNTSPLEQSASPVGLADIAVTGRESRMDAGSAEFNRVLGGGIVPGSLILVGGDPGIGKSTLLLQTCQALAAAGKKVLYISGEESLSQIRIRADRMGCFSGDVKFLCETSLDQIEAQVTRHRPQIVIIDSIQTMYREDVASAPGSVGQVRESTTSLLRLAKGLETAIFIVGHVTKEGTVAGPRVLEHMVDTVLYFEGERSVEYRILRAVKNRFGSTNEIGVFEMTGKGLKEVPNPSEFMLTGRPENASGSVVTCAMEGSRPILMEIQALVCENSFGIPRRTAAGTDYNRVNLLLAVLEKRQGLPFGRYDVYVNVAGGMKLSEPAMDLAIVLAICSSYRDRAIDPGTIIFGEVGLTGEVRAVNMARQRVDEAVKMGFTTCILPKACADRLPQGNSIRIIGVDNMAEAVRALSL